MGTITPAVETGVDGKAQATLTSALQVGVAQVTAQSSGLMQMADVRFIGGQIRGSIYADLNRNGKRDSKEVGFGNVPVSIRTQSSDTTWTVKTDKTGNYMVADLPLTDYIVTVGSMPGLHWLGKTSYMVNLGIEGTNLPELGGSYLLFMPVTRR
jgi:hypothetical protein